MKKIFLVTFMISLVWGCGYAEKLVPGYDGKEQRITPIQEVHPSVPNSYIVMFKTPQRAARLPAVSFLQEAQFHHTYLDNLWRFHEEIQSIRYIDQVDLRKVVAPNQTENFFRSQFVKGFSGAELPIQNAAIAQVDFQSLEASEQILKRWEEHDMIWSAEPNYISYLSQQNTYSTSVTQYESIIPNASWLSNIRLAEAFSHLSTSGVVDDDISSPIIAVLDSGVDVSHSLLKDRIWENPSPGGADCGPSDIYGCDTTKSEKGSLGAGDISPFGWNGTTCPATEGTDTCAHGTHVAGIIAAAPSETNGIGGVCPVCRVMPIKIISGSSVEKGQATDTAILNGIKYVKTFISNSSSQSLVRIVNASFGKSVKSRAVSVVVNVLSQSPFNVLVIGAAGNEDTMKRQYPAALEQALAVSATSQTTGEKARFSNFGPWVDIAAPGSRIQSTMPGGSVEPKDGTSMAAPVVAGVAGLVLSVNPNISSKRLKAFLVDTADFDSLYSPDSASNQNFDFYYPSIPGESVRRPLLGSGLLNAEAAVIGTAKTGQSFNSLNRVEPGCGAVAGSSGGLLGLLIIGLFYRYWGAKEMIGMNLIFHVAAAITCVFLVYWLLLQRQQLHLLRDLFLQSKSKGVHLARPDEMIEKVCKSLDLELENEGNQKLPFRKINLLQIGSVFQTANIRSVKMRSSPDSLKIQLFIESPNGDILTAQQKLSEALGKGVEVLFEEVGA